MDRVRASTATFSAELNEIEDRLREAFLQVKLAAKDQLLQQAREHPPEYSEEQVDRLKVCVWSKRSGGAVAR